MPLKSGFLGLQLCILKDLFIFRHGKLYWAPFLSFFGGLQFSSLNIGGIESGSMQLSSQSPVVPVLNIPFLCCFIGFVCQDFCNGGLQGWLL